MTARPHFSRSGRWSICDENGAVALEFDTFLSLDVSSESQVSSEAVEEGGFASYNKVKAPLSLSVRLAKSGANLSAFVRQLEALEKSLALYSIVTPDRVYSALNVAGVSYARKAGDGIDRLTAELKLVEIRQVAPAWQDVALPAEQTRQGDDASACVGGKKQGQAAPPEQQKRASTLSGMFS